MTVPFDRPTHSRPARARPRTILLAAVIVVLVAGVLHVVAPWILPVRIIEGPLVQMATENGATLVWYTTRPAECTLTLTTDGQQRAIPVQVDDRRHHATIDGLAPNGTYPYEIRVGDRSLTQNLAFQVNRTADEPRYTFIAFGDSGRATREQYELAKDIVSAEPPADFIIHTGDLIYSDGARRKYNERFFTPYRTLLARINFWPCLGNHEFDSEGNVGPYQEVFELPANGPAELDQDRNYWFDYATSRFVVIDTNKYMDEDALSEQVVPWLLDVFAAEPQPMWKFAVFHHPPYTGGKYEPDIRVQHTLVPALEQAGVDIVFNGHDHSYQRTHPLRDGEIVEPGQGPIYVISAAAGASLYETSKPLPPYTAVRNFERFSFTHVTIAGEALTLRQIARGGDVIDELTLQKPPTGNVEDADPASAPAEPDQHANDAES